MLSTPTFFVADRLRGIPLVSNGKSKENKVNLQQHRENQSFVLYDEPTRESNSDTNNDSATTTATIAVAATIASSKKSVLIGKRNAAINIANQQQGNLANSNGQTTVGLLFKPSAMTASTANVVRNKLLFTSTTTQKPPSKRPKNYIRYEAVKPKSKSSTSIPVSKPTITSLSTGTTKTASMTAAPSTTPSVTTTPMMTTTTTTTTTQIPTTPSHTTTNTSIVMTTKKPTTAKISSKASMETSRKTTTGNHLLSTKSFKIEKVALENGKPITTNVPILTRVAQATQTTHPGFQRRTPQSVLSSKFTNRPNDARNGFAGENWVLFNRQDGQFSVFEVLTLMSCIMIVSTIFLVILFNWVKSFQKKRKSTQLKQPDAMENGSTTKLVSKSPTISQITNKTSDLISKQSIPEDSVGSLSVAGTQKSPSVISTTGTTLGSESKKKVEIEDAKKSTNISDLTPKPVQNSGAQIVGSAMNISSDFKGMSNIANKAMAIVQPTENNDVNSSACTELSDTKLASNVKDFAAKLGEIAQNELQQQQQRTIARSVSDLSGKQKQVLAESMGVEAERVTALEEIFNGSAPNLTNILNPKNELAEKTDKVLKTKDAAKGAPGRTSSSSLESIELPEKLVESIQKAESKNAVPAEQPSPNLLLGQVGTALVSEAQKVDQRQQQDKAKGLDKKTVEQVKPNQTTVSGKEKNTPTANSSNLIKMEDAQIDRPANPMGREAAPNSKVAKSGNKLEKTDSRVNIQSQADVKNHQVVVNKLDKRKTNLEIVDLRDASVIGNLASKANKHGKEEGKTKSGEDSSGWISMDGVAVVGNQSGILIGATSPGVALGQAPGSPIGTNTIQQTSNPTNNQQQMMSPSDIIESRFNVDYRSSEKKKVGQQIAANADRSNAVKNMESIDSQQEEYILNDIENELEQDNKMKNRKYFVYIVHDGHFTAKKECIARIELPQKRRITLAEVRQLISSSQDISLSSLRRSKFKFVTETYRLLNENEDAAVLHQVYPTQGVFLKLNIPEQENPVYPFKGTHTSRLSSGAGAITSSLSQTTIASRRRANVKNKIPSARDNNLPAIEVDYAVGGGKDGAMAYGRMRTSSVGRRTATGGIRDKQQPLGSYRRSKSSVQTGRRAANQQQIVKKQTSSSGDRLPTLGRCSGNPISERPIAREVAMKRSQADGMSLQRPNQSETSKSPSSPLPALSNAASDLGNKVISGAKGLFNATFHR